MLQTMSWWATSVLWLQKQTWMNKQLVTFRSNPFHCPCNGWCPIKQLCDTCVKTYHILSYMYIYNLLEICGFLSLLILTCARSLVYISMYVLNNRLAALFVACGWIFLCTNPKSFMFILEIMYLACCAFLNHNKITKEQKTCILSKKACIFFGCQKITLVDNLLV